MHELSLRHYKAIVLVSELRNFTLASKKLFVSVAALSKAIREAEEVLGFSLFDRSPRGVSVTSQGTMYLPFARTVISVHESATHNAARIQQNLLGAIKIAGTEVVTAAFLFQAVDSYLRTNPEIEVSVFQGEAESLQNELQRGAFDIVIGPKRTVSQDVNCIDVCDVPLYFVSAKKNKFSGRDSIPWRDVVDKALIFQDSRSVMQVNSYLRDRLVLSDWRVLNSLSTALAAVESGRGHMISSAYTRKIAKAFKVDFIRLEPEVRMPVCVYHQAGQPDNSLVRAVAHDLMPFVRNSLMGD